MTREELEKRLESAEKQMIGLQDEIQNLKSKLAETQDEPEIPYFPVFKIDGESSWHVNGLLEVSSKEEAYGKVHDYNYFHTVDYAEEFAEKCKLIAMMLHCKWYLCCDHHSNFNNGDIQKWTVVYNHRKGKFTVEFSRMREWSTIYFDTEENAQKCADWLNEHWRDCDD